MLYLCCLLVDSKMGRNYGSDKRCHWKGQKYPRYLRCGVKKLENGVAADLHLHSQSHALPQQVMSLAIASCILRCLRLLTKTCSWLVDFDFAGSIYAMKVPHKSISEILLRQHDALMFHSKIKRALVKARRIFNKYNRNFSLKITSKVENIAL